MTTRPRPRVAPATWSSWPAAPTARSTSATSRAALGRRGARSAASPHPGRRPRPTGTQSTCSFSGPTSPCTRTCFARGQWSGWSSHGGQGSSAPAAIARRGHRLSRSGACAGWTIRCGTGTFVPGAGWSAWTPLGGGFSQRSGAQLAGLLVAQRVGPRPRRSAVPAGVERDRLARLGAAGWRAGRGAVGHLAARRTMSTSSPAPATAACGRNGGRAPRVGAAGSPWTRDRSTPRPWRAPTRPTISCSSPGPGARC